MSLVGHNGGEQPKLENQFKVDYGEISDFPSLQQWVNEEIYNITGENQIPKYYINENTEGLTIEGVIYVNFGNHEAMLEQQSDGSFIVLEWLNCNGKKIKEAA